MIVCDAMALQAQSTESQAAVDTARRMVEAARSLMWEASGTGFTVNQVVATAGSSLKSFYRCFSSKDELLVALFADDARRGAEALDAMVARRPPPERLKTAVVGLFRFLSVDGQLPYAAALVGEHLRLAQTRPQELAAVRRPFLDIFEREMAAAARRDEIRAGDAGGDARTVFHLVLSHLHALVWHQIEEDPKTLSGQLWAFCAAALRPEQQVQP
jgi:AcrR family transcriptional regulator